VTDRAIVIPYRGVQIHVSTVDGVPTAIAYDGDDVVFSAPGTSIEGALAVAQRWLEGKTRDEVDGHEVVRHAATPDRVFWDRFIEHFHLTYSELGPVHHHNKNNVKLAMPAPFEPLVAYRARMDRPALADYGVFLRCRGPQGSAAFNRLKASLDTLHFEPGVPVRFVEAPNRPPDIIAQQRIALLSDPTEDGQIRWVGRLLAFMARTLIPEFTGLGTETPLLVTRGSDGP
jgi:hypothetical protein